MGHQRDVRAEYIPLRTRFLPNQGLKEAALLIGKKHVVSWTSATHASSLAGAGYLHKLFTELSTRMETNPTGLGGILIVAAVLVLAREELRAARAVA